MPKRVIYANSIYEVIYEGERIMHLRSERDSSLVIKCETTSEFLKEIEEIPQEEEKNEPDI
jgi:hypothetical protein